MNRQLLAHYFVIAIIAGSLATAAGLAQSASIASDSRPCPGNPATAWSGNFSSAAPYSAANLLSLKSSDNVVIYVLAMLTPYGTTIVNTWLIRLNCCAGVPFSPYWSSCVPLVVLAEGTSRASVLLAL